MAGVTYFRRVARRAEGNLPTLVPQPPILRRWALLQDPAAAEPAPLPFVAPSGSLPAMVAPEAPPGAETEVATAPGPTRLAAARSDPLQPPAAETAGNVPTPAIRRPPTPPAVPPTTPVDVPTAPGPTRLAAARSDPLQPPAAVTAPPAARWSARVRSQSSASTNEPSEVSRDLERPSPPAETAWAIDAAHPTGPTGRTLADRVAMPAVSATTAKGDRPFASLHPGMPESPRWTRREPLASGPQLHIGVIEVHVESPAVAAAVPTVVRGAGSPPPPSPAPLARGYARPFGMRQG